MLSVTFKPYMLSVIMLNVVMLSVVAPSGNVGLGYNNLREPTV
jgi:hypothetical protein